MIVKIDATSDCYMGVSPPVHLASSCYSRKRQNYTINEFKLCRWATNFIYFIIIMCCHNEFQLIAYITERCTQYKHSLIITNLGNLRIPKLGRMYAMNDKSIKIN